MTWRNLRHAKSALKSGVAVPLAISAADSYGEAAIRLISATVFSRTKSAKLFSSQSIGDASICSFSSIGQGSMQIRPDDLTSPQVIELLQEHVRSMRAISPPESCHVLPLNELRSSDVTFWAIWNEGDLAGCAALKELDPEHGEIKSMRTATAYLRKGVASQLLTHIFMEAKRRNYRRLSLETGAQDCFRAARKLYTTHGFQLCEPFGSYWNDPNSVFMTLEL